MDNESYEKYSRENQFVVRSRKNNTNYGSYYSLAGAIEYAKLQQDADEISFYKKLYCGKEEQYFLKKNDSGEWFLNHIFTK